MSSMFRDLDRLLRGRHSDTAHAPDAVSASSLVCVSLVLGVSYGVFMGLYAAFRTENPTFLQIAVSAVKVPLLFLLTLVVTFPSLYVVSALARSPLQGPDTLRLLLAAITVNLALLASFGPVTGFFTLSTDSYPFMIVLNVAFFAISGFVGLATLQRSLVRTFENPPPQTPDPATFDPERVVHAAPFPPPVAAPPPAALRIFRVWIVVYGVVGVQMAWILRPFVGTPGQDFALFRARSSNFFEAVRATLERLFGG